MFKMAFDAITFAVGFVTGVVATVGVGYWQTRRFIKNLVK